MAKTWKTVLIHRLQDREMERCAGTYLHGRLIDIGCGVKPYQPMLTSHVSEYVGLDRENPFNKETHPELVGTAYAIPQPDASFDCALSTAALEHLAEPEAALRECFRVLKPGAHAVYTVPFFWHLHAEPYDYWRFTKHGLDHLFKKVGFEVVEIRALCGFWVTWATLFGYYLERFKFLRKRPLRWLRIQKVLSYSAQGFAWFVEKFDKAEQWTWMYSVVARKPPAVCAAAR